MRAPPLPLLHVAGQAARARHAASFSVAAEMPERAQSRKLRELLRSNQDTVLGRELDFRTLRSPAEFVRRVPLMTARSLEPLVARSIAGERGVLTREAPVYYTRTTGSTGAPKHVPITPTYRRDLQRTAHVALWHLYWRFPEAFTSRALYFVGTRRAAVAADGADIGTMSGFNFTEMPRLVRALYAWPYELFEVEDLKTRTYLALWLASVGEPSIIAGIFPAPIVYLLRELSANAEALAVDVRRGELPSWLALSPAQRAFFAPLCAPNALVAERLRRAARAPEAEVAREAWPALHLVYCWCTSTAALFLPELRRRLPGVAVRDAIYAACEAWASIPMGDEEPGGALATQSAFYEFIDEADHAAGRETTRFAWELTTGRRYHLVVTTAAGLYRYALGDIVEVCGFHHATPKIRFVRKAGATSNILGEKLEEDHVNLAMGEALARVGADLTFFTVAPDTRTRVPHYVLIAEPSGPSDTSAQLERLGVELDAGLCRVAFDYARLRRSAQLGPIRVAPLKRGAYEAYRQSKVGEGSAEAQLKTAHLLADSAQLPPELSSAMPDPSA